MKKEKLIEFAEMFEEAAAILGDKIMELDSTLIMDTLDVGNSESLLTVILYDDYGDVVRFPITKDFINNNF